MDSLQRKVLPRDREAFKEWMELPIQSIERLGMQIGLTPQDAAEFVEMIFGNLYKDLGQLKEEQLVENTLFKTAIQQLKGFQMQTNETGLFSFAEDNELHARIIDLPIEERISVILHSLHEKSQVDIAWIMETPLENVEQLLYKAQAKLNEPDIEKRLEFLNKSFQRLRPFYDERNIFYPTQIETLTIDEPIDKKRRRKKPLVLWLAGSVMLVLILSVAVLRSEAYQLSSAERFIESKKDSFEQELDDRFELIGLPKPDETDGDSSLYLYVAADIYGNETEQKFNWFIRELEKQVEKEGKIDKREAAKRYDELILELRLPSEMLEQLRNEPIKDREQSIEFLDEFAKKNEFLTSAYMRVFGEHSDIIYGSELISDRTVDTEDLMEKKSEFPIELQNAMNGLETQYYSLVAIKDYVPLSLKYDNPEVRETLQRNLHLDADAYIFLIMGGLDALYYGTFQEQMDALLELEKQLPKTKESDPLINRFDVGYTWLVYSMAGLFDGDGIYGQNSTVREEVREKWKKLAAIGESSPAGLVMQEIVDEMEASNWRISFEDDIHSQFFERVKDKLNEARRND